MTFSRNRISSLIFLLVSFAAMIKAQPVRISEEEAQTQKVFIEANREKILGNFENAAFLYKEVLKRDKTNHAAAYELARVYDVLDKSDKAIGSIKMAVAWDKENPWYKMFLADLYEKKGKDKDAAKLYESLVKAEPNNEFYYSKWAFYLVKAQEPEKAIKVYDLLEEKVGVSEDISRRKHSLYLGMGKQKKAIQEYQKLVNAFPYNTYVHHLLADFYRQVGQLDKAQVTYEKILSIDANDAQATLALADALKATGDDATYLNSLQPIFQKEEIDIDAKVKELIPYIRKIADTGDQNLAMVALQLSDILEVKHPDEAKAYSVSGDLLYHSGRNKEALEKYLKAIELDQTVFAIYEQIMYIYLELQDYPALQNIAEQAMDLFPNQSKAYYFSGIALSQQQKSKAAVSAFQQALIMSRKDPRLRFDLHYRLGSEFHKLKQYKRSDKHFDDALKLNPKDYNLLNNYSYYLALRGEQLEKAKGMSALSNELRPNQADYQDTYGWILYKMKEYKAAKEWVKKALNNGGDSVPGILEHYGDILYQLNEVNEAILQWEKALEKGGKSELLEKKIMDRQLYE
ncbi:MAG: tetratricopeptide repeat protein [Bacteroidota bacterium]